MAINFDELPKSNPNQRELLDKDYYLSTVTSAVMTNDYLTIVHTIVKDGQKHLIWDSFFDSDKDLPRYKLAQFIRAVRIPLTGNFELSDLCKVVVNKELVVAIKREQNENYPERNVVDAFDDDIYRPADLQSADLHTSNPPADNSDLPFDADEPSSTGGVRY